MTKPNDPPDKDFRATLPADLQALDRELSGISIEERPSFRPELEGELAEAWKAHQASRAEARPKWRRTLVAAAVAGLMIAGVAVPGARAAVLDLVLTVAEEAFPNLFASDEQAEVQLPEIEVREPASPEPESEVVVSPADPFEDSETQIHQFSTLPDIPTTLPELLSRAEAEQIIAAEYPEDLKEAGIGGSVELRFWVNSMGVVENISYQNGSNHLQLNFAALRAAQKFQFKPATVNGVPVGTLVKVTVHFHAMTGQGGFAPDTMTSRG